MNTVFITTAILIAYGLSEHMETNDPVGDWHEYFTYSNILNEEQHFTLYWNDFHKDPDDKSNDIIEFGMEVMSTGWVAIGISPTAKMPNSDIMLGWVDDDGETHLYDMNTKTERITPFVDDHNDLTLKYGEEIGGMTRIRFTRPKFLCNDEDLAVKVGTTRILFATNDMDPVTIYNGLHQHTLFGGKSINLDVGYQTLAENEVNENTEGIIVGTVRMEDHPIAAQETEYYCKLFELPALDEVHHIIKFAPWIQPENLAYVHHFNLYHCPTSTVNISNIGHGAPCDEWGVEQNMPERGCIGLGVTNAIHVIYAWGVGMVDSVLPENVGVELGGHAPDALRYGMLEMHYDNPKEIKGLIDNSGFTYYYTPKLRPINAGIMTVGHYYDERHFVPEGLTTINYGYCLKDCTENGLPEGGVTQFGIFFHAHPIATALNLRHVRDGVELPVIDSDWGYDFDYQQMVAVDNVKIMPGDDLILECYETNYRNRTTFGGIETSTEMCLAFLWVYPKPEMRTCVSTFTDDDLVLFERGAKLNGYLNDEANLLQYHAHYNHKHAIPINYDITKEGAVAFYENFWIKNDAESYNRYSYKRHLMCYDAVGDVIWHDGTNYTQHVGQIPQFQPRPVEEICYDQTDLDEQGTADQSEGIDDEDVKVIIGVVVAAVVIVILGIIVFCVMHSKKSNGKTSRSNQQTQYAKVQPVSQMALVDADEMDPNPETDGLNV